MTNEMKNMPELRFPKFEGNWLSYALKDVKDPKDKYSFTGGPFGSDLKKSDYKDNGIRIIQLQNINDGNFNDNYKIYTSSEKADILKSCNIYPGDIVIAKMAHPLARATILPQNKENRYLMASDAIRLKVDDKSFNKIFMVNYINSRRFRRQAEDNSSGSTRMRIGLVTLGQLKISSPNKKEQDIIGDFFSKLDRQIELEEQKLEKLEEQKKGYMQDIFSQQLRFKDENGNDYPEWKEKKLYDVVKYLSSKRSSNHYSENIINGEYPVYDAIREISRDINFDVEKSYISILKDGAGVGRLNLRPGKSSVIGTMGYILPQNIDINFLFYYLKTMNFSKYVIGSTIPHLYFKDYSKETILVPIDKNEQIKIGSFLIKLDHIIENKVKKIEILKKRKQGFLQKMFV